MRDGTRRPASAHLASQRLNQGVTTTPRLGTARTIAIRAGGIARTQLERRGLFVAGARRLNVHAGTDLLRRPGG